MLYYHIIAWTGRAGMLPVLEALASRFRPSESRPARCAVWESGISGAPGFDPTRLLIFEGRVSRGKGRRPHLSARDAWPCGFLHLRIGRWSAAALHLLSFPERLQPPSKLCGSALPSGAAPAPLRCAPGTGTILRPISVPRFWISEALTRS